MINIDPYIQRLEWLKEVIAVWIDYYYDVPIIKETNGSYIEYMKTRLNEKENHQ